MWRMGAGALNAVGAVVLAACARGRVVQPADVSAVSFTPVAAAELFEALEARLMEGPVELRYRVTSEGAFAAELEGGLRMEGRQVELAGEGTFGGAAVSLHLVADADSMEMRSPGGQVTQAVPPHLREALVIGLTRMGILHNLARLSAGHAPDRAGGGVREWVQVREVRLDQEESGAGEIRMHFDIHVNGARTADATLWLDGATGLPLRREQVVRFPTGEMRVVERYGFEL